MAEQAPILTPAQSAFLAGELPGFDPARWQCSLAGSAGSDRRFVRVTPPGGVVPQDSRILVVWDSTDNDWPRFLGIVDDLGEVVAALPKVYAHDEQHGLILEEDFGDTTLHRFCLETSAGTDRAEQAYVRVLQALSQWQRIDPRDVGTIDQREMDVEMFRWESEYFAEHCVTEYFGCEEVLGDDWDREADALADLAARLPQVCIHRDFQSENILLLDNRVCFVDFQGARRGPAYYDVASLLYDPYVDLLSPELVRRLLNTYAGLTGHHDHDALLVCALQRLMQALGAYANLSLHKGKDRYRAFIPRALERLDGVVQAHGGYPALGAAVVACRERALGNGG